MGERGQGSGCVASPLVDLSNLLAIRADRVDQLVVRRIVLNVGPLLLADPVEVCRLVPVNHDLVVERTSRNCNVAVAKYYD